MPRIATTKANRIGTSYRLSGNHPGIPENGMFFDCPEDAEAAGRALVSRHLVSIQLDACFKGGFTRYIAVIRRDGLDRVWTDLTPEGATLL